MGNCECGRSTITTVVKMGRCAEEDASVRRLTIMKNNFTIYHPMVNFIFFLVVVIMSVVVLNPIFLCVSLVCAFVCAVYLKGIGILKFGVGLVLPLILLSVIINPIVNQRGSTDLFQLPFGLGSATLESVQYGLTTGIMIGSVIMWFVSFNVIITSDKLTFLFGRILPGSSLIFVMILRFIPRYKGQIKKISEAQQSIGMGINEGKLMKKIRNGTRILSIMFTWALENAIQTADSMKARGYGLKNRTSFMSHKFTFSDKVLLIIMAVLVTGVVGSVVCGYMHTDFFPFFEMSFATGTHSGLLIFVSGCANFALFALIPVWLGLQELFYWDRTEMIVPDSRNTNGERR